MAKGKGKRKFNAIADEINAVNEILQSEITDKGISSFAHLLIDVYRTEFYC